MLDKQEAGGFESLVHLQDLAPLWKQGSGIFIEANGRAYITSFTITSRSVFLYHYNTHTPPPPSPPPFCRGDTSAFRNSPGCLATSPQDCQKRQRSFVCYECVILYCVSVCVRFHVRPCEDQFESGSLLWKVRTFEPVRPFGRRPV